MNSGKSKNFTFPKWLFLLTLILVLAGIIFLTKAYLDKSDHVVALEDELVETSTENWKLKDSLTSLGFQFNQKSTDLALLRNKYETEKELWNNTIDSLETKMGEMADGIAELKKEKDSIATEKNELLETLNKGLNSLSLGQIEILKKQVKEKERQLLKKDKKIFEYRKARDYLSDQLIEANKRFVNNEAFMEEMTTTVVDFYNFLRVLDDNTFLLKEEVKDITENSVKQNSNGYIEGTKIKLNIPAEELYGGSQFLRDMYSRMNSHKKEVGVLRSKHERLKQIVANYDASLAYDELLKNFEGIINKIKIQEREIIGYEIAIRTRYLLIASTDELKEMGIVLRNDWGRPRSKRKIDLTNADLSLFTEIDFEHDTTIKIPDNTKFRSIVTYHKEWARNINKRQNTIYIRDKAKFWELSSILIIETE